MKSKDRRGRKTRQYGDGLAPGHGQAQWLARFQCDPVHDDPRVTEAGNRAITKVACAFDVPPERMTMSHDARPWPTRSASAASLSRPMPSHCGTPPASSMAAAKMAPFESYTPPGGIASPGA